MLSRHALAVVALAVLVTPGAGSAQTSIINRNIQISPAYNVAFQHPTADDGGVINCVYPTPGCVPFNRAACTGPALPINLVITRNTAAAASPGRYAYAWVQPNNGACIYSQTIPCTTDPNNTGSCRNIGGGQSQGVLAPDSNLAGGGGVGLRIPTDFSATLTTVDLMHLFPQVCDPSRGVQFTLFQICFGVDNNGSQGVNDANLAGTTGGQDPSGFFQFPVDTVPPPAPSSISTKSFVENVDVTVAYDTSSNDVKEVRVFSTDDPNNLQMPDCTLWQGNVLTHTTDVSGAASGSATVSVAGVNGRTYAFCARAVDYVGNLSTPSDAKQDSPHAECDFFGCYPNDLQTGYCGAALTPGWFASIAACLGLCRLGRKRRR